MNTATLAPTAAHAATILPAIGAPFEGGLYAGITVHENTPMALILLPGEETSINWKRAGEWAEDQGGVLPSRIDALSLYQNMPSEFDKSTAYWTDTIHPSIADYAFIQDFGYGNQDFDLKGSGYRARAVRRVSI